METECDISMLPLKLLSMSAPSLHSPSDLDTVFFVPSFVFADFTAQPFRCGENSLFQLLMFTGVFRPCAFPAALLSPPTIALLYFSPPGSRFPSLPP